MVNSILDGETFAAMLRGGALRLKAHTAEINDLNVFPIPDGDTGDNMLLTILGGTDAAGDTLGNTAKRAAGGMLMSARGNSGVILSQLFDGIASGFSELEAADTDALKAAFKQGVEYAYRAVIEPVEGTILTVARTATDYACEQDSDTPEQFLSDFIEAARLALEQTPEQLAVLKKAGVVDSGGAGLICIAEGMLEALRGETADESGSLPGNAVYQRLNLDLFTEDSVLEFGYCTEVLVRLQRSKTDIEKFCVDDVTGYLKTVGDSVVAFKNGSVLKIHIHTKTPDAVLSYCRDFGEFLTVKIENMSLQHNNTIAQTENHKASAIKERNRFAVVAVAAGDGIADAFQELGADEIVSGGQSNNPSAEDFIAAFRRANAEVIFVLPNNGNVVLAAKQAAELFKESDVIVIESKTVGEGYAALSMFDPDSNDPIIIAAQLREAMNGVLTAEVSKCVRNADMDGISVHSGEYIGFMGKQLLAASEGRLSAAVETAKKMQLNNREICIIIFGADADAGETRSLKKALSDMGAPEIYIIDGKQEIYDYIIITE